MRILYERAEWICLSVLGHPFNGIFNKGDQPGKVDMILRLPNMAEYRIVTQVFVWNSDLMVGFNHTLTKGLHTIKELPGNLYFNNMRVGARLSRDKVTNLPVLDIRPHDEMVTTVDMDGKWGIFEWQNQYGFNDVDLDAVKKTRFDFISDIIKRYHNTIKTDPSLVTAMWRNPVVDNLPNRPHTTLLPATDPYKPYETFVIPIRGAFDITGDVMTYGLDLHTPWGHGKVVGNKLRVAVPTDKITDEIRNSRLFATQEQKITIDDPLSIMMVKCEIGSWEKQVISFDTIPQTSELINHKLQNLDTVLIGCELDGFVQVIGSINKGDIQWTTPSMSFKMPWQGEYEFVGYRVINDVDVGISIIVSVK